VSLKNLWRWLVGGAVFAVAIYYAHRHDVAHPRITLDDTIPEHQAFVLTVDADRFRGDPVFASLETPPSLVTRMSPCGFDVSTRVHRVIFIVPEGEEKDGSFALAATLNVSQAEIEACGKVLKGSTAVLDRNFYVSKQDERSLAYRPISASEGLVLFGDSGVVATMLDAAQGTRPRLGSQSGHAEVRRALGESKGGVVLSAVLPKSVRDRLRKEIGENETQMAAILTVELAGVALAPDGKGGIVLDGTFLCDSKGDATNVREWADRQLARVKRDIGLKLLLGGTLDGLALQVTDKRVLANVSVSHEILERVYAFMLAQAGERNAQKKPETGGGGPPGFSP